MTNGDTTVSKDSRQRRNGAGSVYETGLAVLMRAVCVIRDNEEVIGSVPLWMPVETIE